MNSEAMLGARCGPRWTVPTLRVKSSLAQFEKGLRNHLDATRLGSVDVKVSDGDKAMDGFELAFNQMLVERVVSRNSERRILPRFAPKLRTGKGGEARAFWRESMLPMTLQFISAMVAHALNERTARRVDYLQEEVRVLHEALATETGKSRISFTPERRRRLALKGKALTPDEREACCQSVRPATLLAWFRQLAAKKYDSSKARRVGHPRKAADLRELVLELARANPGWGYTKIRDALPGLKIEIGRTTVVNVLAEAELRVPAAGYARGALCLQVARAELVRRPNPAEQ